MLAPAGSTELWEFDKETMDEAISLHDKLLRGHLREYSGYEVATEGDAFVIAFHEATDAIRWCIAVQKVRARTFMAVDCLAMAIDSLCPKGQSAWPDCTASTLWWMLSCVMLGSVCQISDVAWQIGDSISFWSCNGIFYFHAAEQAHLQPEGLTWLPA